MDGTDDDGLLRDAARAVYAVPPADFVATRKEWVRKARDAKDTAGARAIRALRKPSVSATAVNALVRAEDPVVEQLRDVGVRLRHAQSALDAGGLAALRSDRDAVLTAWVAAARAHAPGGTLTAAVQAEVRDTAIAALADPEATEVVLSGALTRALAYSGFGEVDVADAVARTSTGVVLTRVQGGRAGEGGAEDAPDEDEPEQDEPGEGKDAGTEPAPDPSPGPDELERLRALIGAAESEVSQARARRRRVADAAQRASSRVTVADQGLEQARRLLAQAEQHLGAARAEAEASQAELDDADEVLTDARGRRDEARALLEEAEDTG